jgi:hypothetical protein
MTTPSEFCGKCGAPKVDATDAFCPKCGASYAPTTPPAPVEPTPIEPAPVEPTVAAPEEPPAPPKEPAASQAGNEEPSFSDRAPAVLRSAAGLHFSVPVAPLADIPATKRPIIAIDPNGEVARSAVIPETAIFAFGNERHGLSSQIEELAVARIRIPMKTGVSSLNIAVAVGVVLYTFMK